MLTIVNLRDDTPRPVNYRPSNNYDFRGHVYNQKPIHRRGEVRLNTFDGSTSVEIFISQAKACSEYEN